jgi:hypothetical protein
MTPFKVPHLNLAYIVADPDPGSRIWDPVLSRPRNPDPGWKKFGSGINCGNTAV